MESFEKEVEEIKAADNKAIQENAAYNNVCKNKYQIIKWLPWLFQSQKNNTKIDEIQEKKCIKNQRYKREIKPVDTNLPPKRRFNCTSKKYNNNDSPIHSTPINEEGKNKDESKKANLTDIILNTSKPTLFESEVKEAPLGEYLNEVEALSPIPEHVSKEEQLLWLCNHRNVGLYVMCDKCKKYRYLKDTNDPLDLPDKWYCYQNPGGIIIITFLLYN